MSRLNTADIDTINHTTLQILRGSYVHLDSSWCYENSCQPYTRLYFVKDGSGYLSSPTETVTMTGGHAYLIPSECSISYGCDHLEKLYFHLSVSTPEQYDLLSKLKSICVLPCSPEEIDTLTECFYSDNYTDLIRLKMLLFKVLDDLLQRYAQGDMLTGQYSDLTHKVFAYIGKNTKINLTTAAIAETLFVSKSKLRNVFREETGIPLGQYIDDRVFLKAKQMLLRREYSIYDISAELGFCDQFYFSRRFKEKFQQTPSEYRKEQELLSTY